MKKVLVILLTVVLVGSLAYTEYSINALTALANEPVVQAVDSTGAASAEEGASVAESPISGDILDNTLVNAPNNVPQSALPAEPSYEGEDGGMLPSPQDENAEEQSYWIADARYAQLIGEYEALAAVADGVTVITGATLSVTSVGAALQSVIKVPGLAKVLSNGMTAPDYADGSGLLLTEREGYPMAGTSSDRSVLRLVEACEGVAVYEATFFFGSAGYPDAPFTAFRTYVVIEADGELAGALVPVVEDALIDEEHGAHDDADAREEGAAVDGNLIPGGALQGKGALAVAGAEVQAFEEITLLSGEPYINYLSQFHAYYLAANRNIVLDAAFTVTAVNANGTVEGTVSSKRFEVNSVSGPATVLTPGAPQVGQTSTGAYLVPNGSGYDATFLFGDIEFGGAIGTAVGGLTVSLLPIIRQLSQNPPALGPNDAYPGYNFTLTLTWVGNWNYSIEHGWFTAVTYWHGNRIEFPIACLDPGINGPESVNYAGLPLYCTVYTVDRMAGIMVLSVFAYGPWANTQRLGNQYVTVPYPFFGDISLRKLSVNPSVTNANPLYSLAGAQYGLYLTLPDAEADVNRVHTFVTNSQGDGGTVVGLRNAVYYIKELVAPPGFYLDYLIYPITHGSTHTPLMMEDDYIRLGDITLIKRSANPSITDGNSCYDLAGAQYGLYKSWADAQGDANRLYTFITNSMGVTGKATNLVYGTYWVKELVAPKGYALDHNVYPVTLNSTLEVFELVDMPYADPALMLVQKLDTRTGEAWGQDDPSGLLLADAEFTVRYWDGYYSTIEEAEASGAPTRTWIFKTIANGRTYLSSNLLVPGSDPLYIDQHGDATIPLGTVAIQETKAPPGYYLPNPNPISVQQVRETGNLMEPITRLNPIIQPEVPRDLEVEKVDTDTRAPVANTEFTLSIESAPGVGDWQVVGVHVTDDYGKCVFSPIAPGSYKLEETRPDPNYADADESGDGPHYFTITEASTDEVQVFQNDLIQVSIEVYKRTIPLTNTALDGSEDNAGNRVGYEEYYYNFGARSTSNVRVDEFVITDSLEHVTSLGYRMTTLWTGTAPPGMDHDNLMCILYKTNKTDPALPVVFGYDYMAANPYNANNPHNNMYVSNQPGWVIWQECVSTTTAIRLDVADLGLAEDEYIIGLRVVYGGVVKGFYTGTGWGANGGNDMTPDEHEALGEYVEFELRDWWYSVVATEALKTEDEMGNETVMRGSIQADLFRNWGAESPVLTDIDHDAVETRVIETFTYDKLDLGIGGGFVSTFFGGLIRSMPSTGDTIRTIGIFCVLAAAAGVSLIALAKRRQRVRGRE